MRKAVLVIAALCAIAAFFGWKVQEAWFAPPPSVGAAATPVAIHAAVGPTADPAPQQEMAGTVAAVSARPLFRPDRLSFRDGAGEGQAGNADLSRLSLIGVLTFGQGLKGIVISRDGSGAGRWELKPGDSLLGFRVKEVRLDGLVLDAEGRKFLLPLYAGPPPAEASQRTDASRSAPPKAPAPVPKSCGDNGTASPRTGQGGGNQPTAGRASFTERPPAAGFREWFACYARSNDP